MVEQALCSHLLRETLLQRKVQKRPAAGDRYPPEPPESQSLRTTLRRCDPALCTAIRSGRRSTGAPSTLSGSTPPSVLDRRTSGASGRGAHGDMPAGTSASSGTGDLTAVHQRDRLAEFPPGITLNLPDEIDYDPHVGTQYLSHSRT